MQQAAQQVKAVIFDMDGVLIDSEMVYLEQMHEQLMVHHPWIQKEDLYPMVGLDDRSTVEFLYRQARRPPEDKSFLAELRGMEERCRIDFLAALNCGVEEILVYLRGKGYRTAIASSSRRAAIEQMLEQCKLAHYFDFTVSGEEFARSKPDPEIYLHTAKKLQVQPQECFVVEDSAAGIAAAVAAGMTVAAVRELRFGQNQDAAHMMIGQLAELKKIL